MAVSAVICISANMPPQSSESKKIQSRLLSTTLQLLLSEARNTVEVGPLVVLPAKPVAQRTTNYSIREGYCTGHK